MSGYLLKFGNAPVIWGSKKQKIVTLSTTEAEFVAACEATKEIIWARRLMSELTKINAQVPKLKIDNQSAIRLIKNPDVHQRSKHIDIKFYFIREKYQNNEMKLEYVSSDDQEADIFTKFKSLGKQKFQRLRNLMNVKET